MPTTERVFKRTGASGSPRSTTATPAAPLATKANWPTAAAPWMSCPGRSTDPSLRGMPPAGTASTVSCGGKAGVPPAAGAADVATTAWVPAKAAARGGPSTSTAPSPVVLPWSMRVSTTWCFGVPPVFPRRTTRPGPRRSNVWVMSPGNGTKRPEGAMPISTDSGSDTPRLPDGSVAAAWNCRSSPAAPIGGVHDTWYSGRLAGPGCGVESESMTPPSRRKSTRCTAALFPLAALSSAAADSTSGSPSVTTSCPGGSTSSTSGGTVSRTVPTVTGTDVVSWPAESTATAVSTRRRLPLPTSGWKVAENTVGLPA
ncbi:hypothetical protein COSO111634_23435 [Corallococcus soli]